MAELIDWELAATTARRLAPAGPSMPKADARAVVRQVRELAEAAEVHVAAYTGLQPASGVRTSVAVVDRGEWARANLASMRHLTGPLLARLAERNSSRMAILGRATATVAGVEVGAALGYLSTKVLGQYDVFMPREQGDGRLSLIAPNLVEVERRLGVDPRDFRMWVCLHEQTHRTQFTAVPWMREHLESLIGEVLDATDIDPAALLHRLREAARTVAAGGKVRPLELLQTPEQRERVDRIQAVMTLLEGHAEQVMDAVGPEVVPSVADIRGRFDARRSGGGPIDRLVRRLLGLEAKLNQYRTGAAFVRAVVAEVGVEGFNAVFAGPASLPTATELDHPGRWVARVHRNEVSTTS